MTNQTEVVQYTHTFEPIIAELISSKQVEQFYKKNSDLYDAIYPNVFHRVTDEESIIYNYVKWSFNNLLNSVNTFGYEDDEQVFCVESPRNIGPFITYGDEIESLEHACYHFAEYRRKAWKQKVKSLESFYTQFMTDWIEGKTQTTMVFEL